jgi:hypothetical protein
MTLVLPKLNGIELAKSAAAGLSQTYNRTPKATRRMMSGAAKSQQNYVKISTSITGSGWMLPGWEGLDFSSSLTLSCAEAVTIANASTVITIPANRRGDVALRCFAYVGSEWVSAAFSTNVNEVTVTDPGGATQFMVGYYPEFSAFVEIVQNGRQGWTLTAEEV